MAVSARKVLRKIGANSTAPRIPALPAPSNNRLQRSRSAHQIPTLCLDPPPSQIPTLLPLPRRAVEPLVVRRFGPRWFGGLRGRTSRGVHGQETRG